MKPLALSTSLKLFLSTITLMISLTACMSLPFFGPNKETQAMVERIDRGLSCADDKAEFWDALYQHVLEYRALPSVRQMRSGWREQFLGSGSTSLTNEQRLLVVERLAGIYEVVLNEVNSSKDPDDDFLGAMIPMELGDIRDPDLEKKIQKINEGFSQLRTVTESSAFRREWPCRIGVAKDNRVKNRSLVRGAEKVFSTIYQNCESLRVAPVSSQSADIVGVTIIGSHPNGIGRMRVVGDLEQLLKTNPYLPKESSKDARCVDTRKSPPIYNYGGKPYANVRGSKEGEAEELDFFRSNGTGTSALGTDCSGFVFASLATAGLKIRAETRMKPVFVNGVSASMFFDPHRSGLTCFDFVEFAKKQTLKSGDIIASKGHVVIVDEVMSDPFGVQFIKTEADCRVENLSVQNLRFTILQSSPYKGGLGVQRAQAADFFSEPDEKPMKDAVLKWAELACLAQFKKESFPVTASTASLVRHRMTEDCFDEPVTLVHQECVESCLVQK